MIPGCESAAEARFLVESARFPPLGKRGFGLLYPDVWEPEGLPATMAKANAETLLLAQVETAAGLEAVEEIAAVDGLDVLWIGQFDLTTSLGIPGDFASAVFDDAVSRILEAADAHGKHVGMVCATVEECRAMRTRGLSMLGYSFDTWLLEAALRDGLAALRSSG
jgi:2-dehydro-3-deoxyglucarate aldolase/4-hydroxy-2-oxoheptanedioate aldolase